MKKNFAYVPVAEPAIGLFVDAAYTFILCWSWQVVQTRYGTPVAVTGVGKLCAPFMIAGAPYDVMNCPYVVPTVMVLMAVPAVLRLKVKPFGSIVVSGAQRGLERGALAHRVVVVIAGGRTIGAQQGWDMSRRRKRIGRAPICCS